MRKFLQIFFLLLFATVLFIPGYTYLVTSGAGETLMNPEVDTATKLLTLFRFFGLYAFTLTWSQIMMGALRPLLQKLYGSKVIKMHIFLGTFTLLLALSHVILFYLGTYLGTGVLNPITAVASYLGPQAIYGYLGIVAIDIMILTVVTALLRKKGFIQKYWKYIHFGNYLVFIFAFLHSFAIGSEAGTPQMRVLYLFFGVTFLFASFYKLGYKRLLQH